MQPSYFLRKFHSRSIVKRVRLYFAKKWVGVKNYGLAFFERIIEFGWPNSASLKFVYQWVNWRRYDLSLSFAVCISLYLFVSQCVSLSLAVFLLRSVSLFLFFLFFSFFLSFSLYFSLSFPSYKAPKYHLERVYFSFWGTSIN